MTALPDFPELDLRGTTMPEEFKLDYVQPGTPPGWGVFLCPHAAPHHPDPHRWLKLTIPVPIADVISIDAHEAFLAERGKDCSIEYLGLCEFCFALGGQFERVRLMVRES